jgi:hypothetical protein
MKYSRNAALRMTHALTEAEIREYVGRCSEENRPWFEAWLRGQRQLDGDLVT